MMTSNTRFTKTFHCMLSMRHQEILHMLATTGKMQWGISLLYIFDLSGNVLMDFNYNKSSNFAWIERRFCVSLVHILWPLGWLARRLLAQHSISKKTRQDWFAIEARNLITYRRTNWIVRSVKSRDLAHLDTSIVTRTVIGCSPHGPLVAFLDDI